MTKLQKLSREQQKILDDLCKESREEILSYKYIEYDEDIRKDIEWLYDISGIKDKPFILFFDSYYESQLASNYGALINVLTNGKKIRGNQVGNQVWNQVRNQVRNQVWKEKLVFFNQYFGLFYESYWLTFYEFFTRTNMINNKDFERWRNILRKGIYSIIFLDNFCIITRVPKTIKLSDRGLHSTSGKALEWINGDGYYFIHGVKFDFELWDKIVKRKITVREVLKITNADQRYIALQYYGPEKLMEELDTKLIDVWKNPRTNTEIELYELSNIIENRKLKLLKYTDPSINKTRIAFTQDDQISALESISLKHNMTFEEYEGIIQES